MFKKIFTFIILFINFEINIFLKIDNLSFNLKKNSLMISHLLNQKSINKFNLLLPNDQIICKSKVFGNDKLDYRIYYNIFSVNTPYFEGDRFEIITTSKNVKSNKISFVILDCYTNSLTWDPINNIQRANANIYKNVKFKKYDLFVKSKKLFNSKLLIKLESYKSINYKKTLKDFTITPNYECYFKNYNKSFKMDFDKNLNLTVQFLENIKFKNYLYLDDIRKTEHFFIYPQSMDFTILIN